MWDENNRGILIFYNFIIKRKCGEKRKEKVNNVFRTKQNIEFSSLFFNESDTIIIILWRAFVVVCLFAKKIKLRRTSGE